MSPPATKSRWTIAVMGEWHVGKSSLISQYVDGKFDESYKPTIQLSFDKGIDYRGQTYHTKIIDTAGQDDYSTIGHEYLIHVNGYVLVYSIHSEKSFKLLSVIAEKIKAGAVSKTPMVIVGNKSGSGSGLERQVSATDGAALANSLGCPFIEADAKENNNVAKAFELIIGEVVRDNHDDAAPRSNGGQCTML